MQATESALRVGGLTPLTATDYPGALAAVVFCQGCPWRCGYCHNPHLLPARGGAAIAWGHVTGFLERRRGLLDAVVFSGGEPLAQRALGPAMRAVKGLGFRVGLHTGGAYPRRLAEVLPLVDWIGFDVKACFADYVRVTAVPGSGEQALESAKLVLASGVEHEFRTTVHPRMHAPEGLERLGARLAALGVRRYVLQEARSTGCADARWSVDAPRALVDDACCARIAPSFASFELRRA